MQACYGPITNYPFFSYADGMGRLASRTPSHARASPAGEPNTEAAAAAYDIATMALVSPRRLGAGIGGETSGVGRGRVTAPLEKLRMASVVDLHEAVAASGAVAGTGGRRMPPGGELGLPVPSRDVSVAGSGCE